MADNEKKPYWEGKKYSFFQNKECEYFPCHKTNHPEDFNCIFCYCPLYALGDRCGGAFTYTDKGYKNCENCLKPHIRKNFGLILEKYPQVAALASRKADTKPADSDTDDAEAEK